MGIMLYVSTDGKARFTCRPIAELGEVRKITVETFNVDRPPSSLAASYFILPANSSILFKVLSKIFFKSL